MAKRGSTDEQTSASRIEAAKIMEDGHPDPTRMGFWAMVDEISKRGLWDHYMIYGYRTEPEHVKEQDPAAAFKKSEPITIADIAAQYGGYKWTLNLNRTVGGKNRKVLETRVDIKEPPILQEHEQLVPPPVRAGAVAATAGAAGTEQAMGLLSKMVDDLTREKAAALEAGREFNPADALNKTIGLMEIGYKKMLETQGNGGGLDLAKIIGLITALTPIITLLLTPKKDRLTEAIIEKFMAEQSAPKQNPEAAGVDSTIKLINTIMENFGRKFAGGAGKGGGADWTEIALKGLEKLPEVAQGITTAIMRAGVSPGGFRPASGPVALQPQPRPAVVQSITGTPAARVNPLAAPLAEPSRSTPQEIAPDMAREFYWALCKTKLVEKFLGGQDPDNRDIAPGEDAALILDEISRPIAQQLARMFRDLPANPDILAEFQSDPIIGPLFGNPKVSQSDLLKFATDYVEWFGDDLEESPAAEPPSAAPASAEPANASA